MKVVCGNNLTSIKLHTSPSFTQFDYCLCCSIMVNLQTKHTQGSRSSWSGPCGQLVLDINLYFLLILWMFGPVFIAVSGSGFTVFFFKCVCLGQFLKKNSAEDDAKNVTVCEYFTYNLCFSLVFMHLHTAVLFCLVFNLQLVIHLHV